MAAPPQPAPAQPAQPARAPPVYVGGHQEITVKERERIEELIRNGSSPEDATAAVMAQKRERAQQMEKRNEDILYEYGNLFGGTNTVPAFNNSQQQGFNLDNPAALGVPTYMPLPFDKRFRSQLEDEAIASQYGGEQNYLRDEGFRRQLENLAPAIQTTLQSHPSIYRGTTDNYMENRLNILMQRRREHSVYAFV